MPRRDVIAALPDDVIVEEMICDGADLVVSITLMWPTITVSSTLLGAFVVLDPSAVRDDPRTAWRIKERLREEEASAPLEIPLLPSGW